MMEIDARGLSLYVDTAKKTPTPSCTNRGNFYLIYFLLQKLGSVGLLARSLAWQTLINSFLFILSLHFFCGIFYFKTIYWSPKDILCLTNANLFF